MLSRQYLSRLPQVASWAIAIVTVTALSAGLYGRFKGLGTWPLGVDEFYVSRSIDNVMRVGLPQFPCGGYYTRGVLYQYAVALLRLGGLSAEFAGRLLPAISSLAVLPAAYLLGRRIHGRTVGLLVVTILSVSIWEIEMARFARMYAPFQAVFAWYLVFFLRYTFDHHRKDLVAMVVFSVLGILTWEGGVFIGIVNMLPPLINQKDGRLRRTDWVYLVGMIFLLALLILATRDLREFATPPLQTLSDSANPEQHGLQFSSFLVSVRDGWGWFALSLLPLGFAAASWRWIWSLRGRWLAACGIAIALLSATLHQFLAAASTLLLLLLLGLLDPRELTTRAARSFWLCIAANAIFWLGFCVLTGVWNADVAAASTIPNKMMAAAQYLVGFPNILQEIVRPWGRVLPLLAIGLLTAVSSLILRVILRRERFTTTSALLTALVFLILAVGAISTDRVETRYTFFLYPLAITLALAALASWSETYIGDRQRALLLASLAGLVLFGLSEDFQPRHLAHIDSADITFRIGMPPTLADHYYQRSDTRGTAQWLTAHVHQNDIVINSIPTVDNYYRHISFFFLDVSDPRYETYVCPGGVQDRWTQRPLLYTLDALRPYIATGHRLFLITYPDQAQTVLKEARIRGWSGALAWTSIDTGINVIVLKS
jgi:hypothetical protein